MTKKSVSADELIAVVLKAIDEIKGVDIQILDLRENIWINYLKTKYLKLKIW